MKCETKFKINNFFNLLSSVLEAEKTLVLAEKGGQDDEENEVELLVAGKKFRILATMNPGGDFGKKEVNVKATGRTACIFWSY